MEAPFVDRLGHFRASLPMRSLLRRSVAVYPGLSLRRAGGVPRSAEETINRSVLPVLRNVGVILRWQVGNPAQLGVPSPIRPAKAVRMLRIGPDAEDLSTSLVTVPPASSNAPGRAPRISDAFGIRRG